MKKLLIVVGLLIALQLGYRNRHLFLPKDGAFDKSGNPIVRVFVGPECGALCAEVEGALATRNVPYERLDVSTPAGQKYDVRSYPLTMVGARRVAGNDVDQIASLLAETYGDKYLTGAERRAMAGHFDAAGKPAVVLYGTQWCGYCKMQREFFQKNKIPFADVDVEASLSGKWAYDMLRGRGYPLVYVGYRRFDGYNDAEIQDALTARR